MSTHIPFTDNYDDLSTERGYRFRFNCQCCGNGYLSSFQASDVGLARGVLESANSVFGGVLGRAAQSANNIQRRASSMARDHALREAVEETALHFAQCRRCGNWVCRQVCWNESGGQCVNCEPRVDEPFDEEFEVCEAEATLQAIRRRVYGTGANSNTKGQSAASPANCPQCGAENAPGQKFCGECGTNVLAIPKCPSCGTQGERGQKFCGECGSKF
jgi:hypothetical protein